MPCLRRLAILVAVVTCVPAALAQAQSLGSFRWQLRPFCNVLTITITQEGAVYALDGTDDQCGAVRAASLRGMAFANPDGTIGFGLTVVTSPGARPVHVDAAITAPLFGGAWQDSAGNAGTFVFTPGPAVAGALRPVPAGGLAPGSITNVHLAAGAVTGASVADGSLTRDDFDAPPQVAFANSDQSLALTLFAQTVVRTVGLMVPTFGRVIVTASGTVSLDTAGRDAVICSITRGASMVTDSTQEIWLDDQAGLGAFATVPLAITRAFLVNPNDTAFNLVCRSIAGVVTMRDTSLTVFYLAQ